MWMSLAESRSHVTFFLRHIASLCLSVEAHGDTSRCLTPKQIRGIPYQCAPRHHLSHALIIKKEYFRHHVPVVIWTNIISWRLPASFRIWVTSHHMLSEKGRIVRVGSRKPSIHGQGWTLAQSSRCPREALVVSPRSTLGLSTWPSYSSLVFVRYCSVSFYGNFPKIASAWDTLRS